MTRTQIKLQQIKLAEAHRRWDWAQLRQERKVSQLSSFILVAGEMLDDWVPFGLASKLSRAIVRRRIRRQGSSL